MSSATETVLYFAYASNLFSGRLKEQDRTANRKSVALLKGYKLEFVHWSEHWGGSIANIVRDHSSHVYGVLWEIPTKDLTSLDKQEAALDGIYERIEIKVQVDGKQVECWVYKLTPESRDKTIEKFGKEKLKPSLRYKEVILKGANESQIPSEYFKFLEGIECHD